MPHDTSQMQMPDNDTRWGDRVRIRARDLSTAVKFQKPADEFPHRSRVTICDCARDLSTMQWISTSRAVHSTTYDVRVR